MSTNTNKENSMETKLLDHRITVVADFPAVRIDQFEHAYEVDRVRVELDWFGSEDYMHEEGDPDGWNVDVDVKGWPLTKAGKRNRTAKNRDNLYRIEGQAWPEVVLEAAKMAYARAIFEGKIDASTVLGDDGQPGTPLTLLR